MTDQTPAPAPDRPLVTFALFAYNQEAYIREAVEGAFSQTYEPLEIILSDDCSTDRTYEIMQEMAAAYEGPHEVRVRRSSINLGLVDHINEVAREAKGQVIVMAAGDDISMAERTECLAEAFSIDQNTKAVLSDYSTIPRSNNANRYGKLSANISLVEILIAGGGVQKGATYAYSKNCFSWCGEIPSWVTSEDRILPLRAVLLGAIKYCDKPLVQYRLPRDQGQRAEKQRRVLGYNHPMHFDLLLQHLRFARHEKYLMILSHIFYIVLLKWVRVTVLLKKRGGIWSKFGDAAFIPIRIIRKASSILLNYT